MKILLSSMPVHYNFDIASMRTMPNTAIYLLAGILRKCDENVTILDPSFIRDNYNPSINNSFKELYDLGLLPSGILELASK